MLNMELKGSKALQVMLDYMTRPNTAKAIMRKATREGSNIIQTAVKTNAKSMLAGSGKKRHVLGKIKSGKRKGQDRMGNYGALIASNITTRAKKKQKNGEYAVNVMIGNRDKFVSVSKAGKESYIPAAIEYGHTLRTSDSTKTVAPIPFMRKAFDEKGDAAIKRMIDVAWKMVLSISHKLKKGA